MFDTGGAPFENNRRLRSAAPDSSALVEPQIEGHIEREAKLLTGDKQRIRYTVHFPGMEGRVIHAILYRGRIVGQVDNVSYEAQSSLTYQ